MNCKNHDSSKPKLLLIGLDALDWELLSKKIAAGELPHIATLIASGASGPLRSTHPLFSPALWATIATGKRPYEHGITGFTLPDEEGTGLRPYNSTSRRSPALWEMFSSAEKTSHVIGWWTSAPAEPLRGVMVDETFRVAQRPCNESWPVAPKSIFPEELSETLARERVHPQKLPESLLHRLVPRLYEIDPSTDVRLSGIAKILAEDLTTLQVTLHLMSHEPSDFTTLYLIGLDSLAHQGMGYRDPTAPGTTERDCELYGTLVDNAYELYDSWVGKLVKAAGEKTTIVIVSDHGFYHDHRKPHGLGIEATAPCAHHAPMGSLIMSGPLIKKGTALEHTTILDICPTLLTLLDLPIGKDMLGNVLESAFQKSPVVKKIISWDKKISRSFSKQSEEPSTEATQAALRQLVALGYLPELPSNNRALIEEAQCNQLFHLGLSYLNSEQMECAIPLLEQARIRSQKTIPNRTDILTDLAFAYLLVGETRSAAANLHQLVRCRRRDARQAVQELSIKSSTINASTRLSFSEIWELRSLMARANLDEEALHFTKTLAREIISPTDARLAFLFSFANQHPKEAFFNLNAGLMALIHGAYEKGCTFLHRAAAARPEEAEALTFLAQHKNERGAFLKAEELARTALQRNPLSAASWLALATALTHQSRWQEARRAALRATHSTLRKSKAYELLATIALKEKKDVRRAERYQLLAQKAARTLKEAVSSYRRNSRKHRPVQTSTANNNRVLRSNTSVIPSCAGMTCELPTANFPSIVVTGLPRSGTSLIMQMLSAGGIRITTDHRRPADAHNPQGYFEYEKIKNIAQDTSFLESGNASKIVIPLVWELPPKGHYKIIFIRRSLAEVIESQHRMAGRIGTVEELESVYRFYEKKTAVFLQQYSWPLLELQHAALLADPQKTAKMISDFLGIALNVDAMAAAVLPELHRVRK